MSRIDTLYRLLDRETQRVEALDSSLKAPEPRSDYEQQLLLLDLRRAKVEVRKIEQAIRDTESGYRDKRRYLL